MSVLLRLLRAYALYAASCSGVSLGGLKWFPCAQACYREGSSCEHFGGYKTINRRPLPFTVTVRPIRATMYLPHTNLSPWYVYGI